MRLNDVEKTSIWSVIIPYALVMIVMFFVMFAVREIITGRWRPDDELWQEQGENDRA